MIAHFGFLGFLCNLPGLERAAGMFGFFGFIGVATFFEFRARYRHRRLLYVVTLVLGLVTALAITAIMLKDILPIQHTAQATVVIRDATVDERRFSFRHEVSDCPEGWNAWLTLECVQLFRSKPDDDSIRQPSVVKRYQAKLNGHGQVQVPLDYQPSTNENRQKMLASIGPQRGWTAHPSAGQGYSLLAYTTESLMRVSAKLILLPDMKTPDSQLNDSTHETVRFVTIEPPVKPKLAPFEGAYSLGKIEIVALTRQGSKDEPLWKPNGEPSSDGTLFNRSSSSSAAGKVIKEINIRIRSDTNIVSNPIIRSQPDSGVSIMGGSVIRETTQRQNVTVIQRLACPPELLETNIEVGIADGDWKESLTFNRHPKQHHFGASTSGAIDGDWEGNVRTTEPTGDSIPLAFSFSDRDDHETRLVYEKVDGTIVPLKGNGSDGGHGLTNLLTTLPLDEFESIERFHVQSRRYEWIEFRNVSLQLGHHTEVEVQSTYE